MNLTFDEFMRSAALLPNNLEFLDFLQSDQCKQIFIKNKLKISVESGNIYYDNTDTNEGILDFIFNQQNPVNQIHNQILNLILPLILLKLNNHIILSITLLLKVFI